MTDQAVLAISCPGVQRDAEARFQDSDDIEARLRICYEESWKDSSCWMVTNDDVRMRVGIGALLMHIQDRGDEHGEDWDRVQRSLTALKALSAAMSGVPVDFGALDAGDYPAPLIGLMPIYREVKAEKEAR